MPLIKVQNVILDAPAIRTIVEWIVMKVFVAENSTIGDIPPDPIFDQVARTAFMNDRTIPPWLRIWMAHHKGTKWMGSFHRHASGIGVTSTLPPPPVTDPTIKNVQVVTWGIGRLLIYVNATTNERVYPFLELGAGPLIRLWLPPDQLLWPPQYFVLDLFIDDLTQAIENLILGPNVIHQ